MRIISKRQLLAAAREMGDTDTEKRVAAFLLSIRSESWTCFQDIQKFNKNADLVKGSVVFDLGSVRLITRVSYAKKGSGCRTNPVYFKYLWTHDEYQRWRKSKTPKR